VKPTGPGDVPELKEKNVPLTSPSKGWYVSQSFMIGETILGKTTLLTIMYFSIGYK